MAKLSALVPVFLLAIFVREGEPIRCWTCSSDLNPLCNDPFLPAHTENAYLFRLENCDATSGISYPYLSQSKPVCKKQKKFVQGTPIISRGCSWKGQDDYSNQCLPSSNGAYEVTSYCETCEYDGCNSASVIGKTLALLIAPLSLLLFK